MRKGETGNVHRVDRDWYACGNVRVCNPSGGRGRMVRRGEKSAKTRRK